MWNKKLEQLIGKHCRKLDNVLISFLHRELLDSVSVSMDNVVVRGDDDDGARGGDILILAQNVVRYEKETLDRINNYVQQNKIVILIVPVSFDFGYFAKRCESSSIDVIKPKEIKKEYCIFIKKD